MTAPTIKDFFKHLPGKFDAEAADDLEAVYQFDLGGQYVITIRKGGCQVREGRDDDPHVTLSMAGEDCIKVLNGQLSGPAAAMSGRITITGDMGLAMQLKALFPTIGEQL
jgi:putative sterol carrier protein